MTPFGVFAYRHISDCMSSDCMSSDEVCLSSPFEAEAPEPVSAEDRDSFLWGLAVQAALLPLPAGYTCQVDLDWQESIEEVDAVIRAIRENPVAEVTFVTDSPVQSTGSVDE